MSAVDRTEKVVFDDPADLMALYTKEIQKSLVELVPIASLLEADSPRGLGENSRHVQILAETESPLPPIIVHRGTMRVIDGMHRVRAAQLRGEDHIPAHFYEGRDEDVFLLSVAVNMAHGLPLSLTDRTAAAERIFGFHPQWSDRAVALVAGISAKKASEIRDRLAGSAKAVPCRVGRDGRSRPLNGAKGRERASALIKQDPEASLRQIAKAAGISPATAADVRDRLRRGVAPVPQKQRETKEKSRRSGSTVLHNDPAYGEKAKSVAQLISISDRLRKDPSLRFNDVGRTVLRMLDACAVAARDKHRIVEALPPHCRGPIAELVHGYAEIWRSLGEELEHAKYQDTHHPESPADNPRAM
ncbi:ParB N-terminal domain-containing protein [Streptomyces sp. NPDC056909]|uniref:ParB/RepB/Spo0J family partition protein n=1 Tax=Streptomyces sp. NPDC056909 TaxID=3345963 RepID=UPI0036C941F7